MNSQASGPQSAHVIAQISAMASLGIMLPQAWRNCGAPSPAPVAGISGMDDFGILKWPGSAV
jgi:hypothetical protein